MGGHTSSILAVYWRVDLDYLLVRCSNGTVYIWQVSTGLLERRVHGRAALELIERSEGLGTTRRPTVRMNIEKLSGYTAAIKGFLETRSIQINGTEPEVQLLMLSVRRVIGYIHNSKQEIIVSEI